jgi:hypothetical protein
LLTAIDFAFAQSGMSRIFKLLAALLVLILLGLTAGAAHAEKRIALVIGNAEYQVGALNTPANDAGLIAQTLQASGFDVVGARDLDQDSLRRAFRDFLDQATAARLPGRIRPHSFISAAMDCSLRAKTISSRSTRR